MGPVPSATKGGDDAVKLPREGIWRADSDADWDL